MNGIPVDFDVVSPFRMGARREEMELQTISQVSKRFQLSTRTLRYYEQIGLLPSVKKEDYAYRTYDEQAVHRLRQIILMRKLRIPLKQIADILASEEAFAALEAFQRNLAEIDREISALSTIRSTLAAFVSRLGENASARVLPEVLADEELLRLVEPLSLVKLSFKEEKTMQDLNRADERLSKLKNVRIVHLPPMTVAASHYVGPDCEMHAGNALDKFVRESGLLRKKPDVRHIGFNNPVACGGASTGYEMWVSITEDMEVPEPLVKKQFHGGLYAAHAIAFGDFEQWGWLVEWVLQHDRYESDWEAVRCRPYAEGTDWALEEQLNYWNNARNPNFDYRSMQLDLLFPIKEKAR